MFLSKVSRRFSGERILSFAGGAGNVACLFLLNIHSSFLNEKKKSQTLVLVTFKTIIVCTTNYLYFSALIQIQGVNGMWGYQKSPEKKKNSYLVLVSSWVAAWPVNRQCSCRVSWSLRVDATFTDAQETKLRPPCAYRHSCLLCVRKGQPLPFFGLSLSCPHAHTES